MYVVEVGNVAVNLDHVSMVSVVNTKPGYRDGDYGSAFFRLRMLGVPCTHCGVPDLNGWQKINFHSVREATEARAKLIHEMRELQALEE
jgi:hypothetical protein